MEDREFHNRIRHIIQSDEYRTMRHYRHHIKGSVYDHSLKVARMCWRHHRRFGSKFDMDSFLRGALLHDYYLYDWHDKDPAHRFHGFTHPRRALNNALEKYPDLTQTERDMILHHMFPLTPVPPKTRAGWLLCFYDKIAALSDYFGKNHWKARHPTPAKKRPVRKNGKHSQKPQDVSPAAPAAASDHKKN